MAKKNHIKIEGGIHAPTNIGPGGNINIYHGNNDDETENQKTSALERFKTLSEILGNIWPYLLIAALILLALFWPGVLDKIKDLLSGILGLVG